MFSELARLRYLLDTNAVSDMMREPDGALARRVAALEEGSFGVSVIVAAELRYGAARRASPSLDERLETILSAVDVLPLEEPAARHYGAIRADLERVGRSIGHNDLLIAAHARALGAVLVTDNVGEFRRVPGLEVENWR